MTKEQLEKELIPLNWRQKSYTEDLFLYASANSLNYWYNIYMRDGKYVVNAENDDWSIHGDITTEAKSVEEAKEIAWNDYVEDILNLFKKD